MASGRRPGALDPETAQSIVDGTLCRSESPIPGSTGLTLANPLFAPQAASIYIYCEVWSDKDRRAFWRGFLSRLVEYGQQAQGVVQWLQDAFGQGDEDGDFAKAWKELATGLGSLARLSGKILVVSGIPPYGLHPHRHRYQNELMELGVHVTREFIEGFKKSYREGGIPQCTGRILADVLVILFEVVATKGAGKALHAAKATKLTKLLPQNVQRRLSKSVPDRKKVPDTPLEIGPLAGATDEEIEAALRVMTSRGKLLTDLMLHGQRRKALDELRRQLGRNVRSRPGKTPQGASVNPTPGYQSAHTTAQSALRSLPEYNPGEMITRFLPTGRGHAHTLFDQHWQRQFREIRAQTGRTTITARELEEVTARAARQSGAFSSAEAESVVELIKNDLYFQLKLSPSQILRMPGT